MDNSSATNRLRDVGLNMTAWTIDALAIFLAA